jgi:phage shock protein C
MEGNMAGRLDDVSVRWNVYRNPSRGKIAGVCAGLSDRTGIKANWIRLGFILAAVTIFHAIPAVLLYLALALVMRPRTEPIGYVVPDGMPGYQMAGPPPGPTPMGPPPGTRLNDIRTRFTAIDARLARIEAVVTSEELSLRRKFRDLGG